MVLHAFGQAGLAALAAIALLLGLMLRRWLDAVLVVLPLVMGALYTVIGLVFSGISINFANIIALPLLLGIGVAFNIYYVVNWRDGVTRPLQSATTRAVLFSALTTGSAFGSLAVSPISAPPRWACCCSSRLACRSSPPSSSCRHCSASWNGGDDEQTTDRHRRRFRPRPAGQ